ncbi:MAG: hypothetical protein AB8G05_11770 [Oligoflexales bacterium]
MNRVSQLLTSRRITLLYLMTLFLVYSIDFSMALGDGTIPGSDSMDKLTAAGTLLHIVDSFLFKFGARILAGISILGAGWNLKEQRFAMAIVCILGAIIMGTVPMWVKNIFDMSDGGGGSIFNNIGD